MSDQTRSETTSSRSCSNTGAAAMRKVLIGMNQNLTDAEIAAAAAGEPIKVYRITEVRRNVPLTLDDKLAKRGALLECAGVELHAGVGSPAVNR